MSKTSNYYVEQMERKFGEVQVSNQDAICKVCDKPFWMHKGCECPLENSAQLDMEDKNAN